MCFQLENGNMAEETITFEFLRSVQRKEKSEPTLSKIPSNFFEISKEYLERKRKMIKDKKDEYEVRNIKRVLEDIFNTREKKIINFALLAARTDISIENLTEEEKEFFEKIKDLIKKRRKNVLISLSENNKVRVKFLQDMPKFIGMDEVTYGPFKSGDEADIPIENARVLEEKNIVKIIS